MKLQSLKTICVSPSGRYFIHFYYLHPAKIQTCFSEKFVKLFWGKFWLFLRPKTSIFQKMVQMQLLEILCKRSCCWKFREFLGKAPVLKCLIKKRLQHGCFPVKLTKFLKTSILKNIREQLLLITIKFIKPNKILSLRSLATCEITRIYHFCYTSSFTCNKKKFW